jgi:uncharacterized membrane protein
VDLTKAHRRGFETILWSLNGIINLAGLILLARWIRRELKMIKMPVLYYSLVGFVFVCFQYLLLGIYNN